MDDEFIYSDDLEVVTIVTDFNTPAITNNNHSKKNDKVKILFITSFPPRECGIATYSQDLISSLRKKFGNTFEIVVCPVESECKTYQYSEKVPYCLATDSPESFLLLADTINSDSDIQLVVIQHEFGFFEHSADEFRQFLFALSPPIVMAFHTVLPHPNQSLHADVQQIVAVSESIIVMTNSSAKVLVETYGVSIDKITVIPHGTHLVSHTEKNTLKKKYNLSGRRILSTFGLLSSGKSIETTLDALPAILECNPDVLFLIIGKTHPSVIQQEGEQYRNMLQSKVIELNIQKHVVFINHFLPLKVLLEFLQLTDIYLFTSKDPNQAVSGTFSYAISSGCPVISTAIPHACEVLQHDAGIIIDFENSQQLSEAVLQLLNDEELQLTTSSNALHRMASTVWENSAIAHALLFEQTIDTAIEIKYSLPDINLDHIKRLTTKFGMIQFSHINLPDIESGYTLDDNARALIAMCQHYKLTRHSGDLEYIKIYYNFIQFCFQDNGSFLNYVNEKLEFTEQNQEVNLSDANGRAIWALGFMISMGTILPHELNVGAEYTLERVFQKMTSMHSTRAMAFAIKGLYYRSTKNKTEQNFSLIRELSFRLVQMYLHEKDSVWRWFESYLTYANSIIPEALLCAWLVTGDVAFKEVAKTTFDFLLSKTFSKSYIHVVSNRNWMDRVDVLAMSGTDGGEQPIDVAYTILALDKFYMVFKDSEYKKKIEIAFNWFLGVNHLNQIIYNPCTGGCYDGLEDKHVNLNQGAESTVSYLMARLTVEKYQQDYHANMVSNSVYVLSASEQFM